MLDQQPHFVLPLRTLPKCCTFPPSSRVLCDAFALVLLLPVVLANDLVVVQNLFELFEDSTLDWVWVVSWLLHEDDDGLVCEDELILLVDLLEDELILALPMVGKHPEGECKPAADVAAEPNTAVEPADRKGASKDTYRPFAGLAGLTADMLSKKEK